MRKNTLGILIFIICLPLWMQGATLSLDSLRNLVPSQEGRERHFTLARIAMATGNVSDWDKVVENACAQEDTVSICMALTNRFICLFNYAPADSLSEEIQHTLSYLRDCKQWTYYFITYQTYINSLFRKRQYEDAEQAAADMLRIAQEEQQLKGMAMALQVQGSMYYQLNLYNKAMDALEEALRICPDFRDKENNTLMTSASICEWICMTALKINDSVKLSLYASKYAEILAGRYKVNMGDPDAHFTVTSIAFRAQALLSQGKVAEAERLLNEAQQAILPTVPARAYEHYYEARIRQYILQKRYKDALANVDILLETHTGYFPFYLHDMLLKADILAHLHRPDESRKLYFAYMQAKDSIDRVEIATHMDKLNTLYQLDRLTAEKRVAKQRLVFTLYGSGIMLGLLFGYIFYTRSLHRKNHALYLRIRQQEKMEKRVLSAIEILPVEKLSKEAQLFYCLSERMHNEKLYVNPNLSRKELAALMGTNENYLANAIRNNTDNKTYHEYITDIRMKHAVALLLESPDTSIETISEAVGFNSRSTFFRAFRNTFGMSPSDFRKESRKNTTL